MRAFITGGAGFIGSHLSELLLNAGHEVCILDDLSTGSLSNISHLDCRPGFQAVVGSILEENLVDKLVERCDMVFHLAAAVGVELIVRRTIESLETNIRGSENVLRHAHRYRKPILIASTSEIYGKNTDGHLKEDDDRILGSPLKSRWSYSTAKAVDEILAYAHFKSSGLPTVIVRLFNVVGPRQTGTYGMVVPRFVRQALLNEPITVFGDGEQSRCFGYVGDVVQALYGLMMEPRAAGTVFNVGSLAEISIVGLAEKIIAKTGSTSKVVKVPYAEAYEEGFEDMMRRQPCIDRITDLTGWEPTTTLDETIDLIIEDMRARLALEH